MRIPTLSAILLVLHPLTAYGQHEQQPPALMDAGTTYVGAKLGGIVPLHEDVQGFDPGLAFDFTVGHRLDPNFAVEASVGRFRLSGVADLMPTGAPTLATPADLTAVPVQASARAVAPLEKVELYGVVGGGLYFISARTDLRTALGTVSVSDDARSFGFHVGGGLSARVSPRLLLGGELKYVIGRARILDATIHYDSALVAGTLNWGL